MPGGLVSADRLHAIKQGEQRMMVLVVIFFFKLNLNALFLLYLT